MPAPDILNHPAFQSVVLPLLLCFAGAALLHRLAGARWAVAGVVFGLLLALAWFPGFDWPASARAQKLPWIALAGTAVALLVPGLRRWAPRSRGVALPAGLTAIAIALAAWAGTSGSLLLAQLALMLAVASAVATLWAWRRPPPQGAASPAFLLPIALACLTIAWAMAGAASSAPANDDPYYAPQWK